METKNALARLRAIKASGERYTLRDVMDNFMGGPAAPLKVLEALIDLLERSDPAEWTDEQLADAGLVRLPRDGDGEAVHIRDEVWDDEGKAWKVGALHLYDGGESFVSCLTDDANGYRKFAPQILTHHPPVTVESVLREFTQRWFEAMDTDEVFAEYASKLRLVETDE